MEGRVKVYDLTAEDLQWEVEAGKNVKAWAYNGQVPGPQIRVREGDRVRINLTNKLPESTSIHFHGLELPNDQDGVPFITQPPVKPGESLHLRVHRAERRLAHVPLAPQRGEAGRLGPAGRVHRRTEAGRCRAQGGRGLRDGPERRLPRLHPEWQELPGHRADRRKRGQTVRIRFMNEGMMIHPMHLHGMHMTVIAKDGWHQPAPWKCDTLNVAPGERWDVIVKCTNPGTWAFHCHILPHAESDHGMFGMVTALVVKPPLPDGAGIRSPKNEVRRDGYRLRLRA